MKPERFNKVILVTGGRGTGKTTFAKSLFPLYSKVLILDTIDHPSYREFQEIAPDQLGRWIKGTKRIFRGIPFENLEAVNQQVHNGLIVFEDARKYIRRSVPEALERIIADSKQKNNDILFLYHSLNQVPPFIYEMIDFITIFYTNETVSSTLKNKIPSFEEVREAHEKVKAIAEAGRKTGKLSDKRRYFNLTIEVGA